MPCLPERSHSPRARPCFVQRRRRSFCLLQHGALKVHLAQKQPRVGAKLAQLLPLDTGLKNQAYTKHGEACKSRDSRRVLHRPHSMLVFGRKRISNHDFSRHFEEFRIVILCDVLATASCGWAEDPWVLVYFAPLVPAAGILPYMCTHCTSIARTSDMLFSSTSLWENTQGWP